MRPILVTGGARGLGAEICIQLAGKGHEIVVHYRDSEEEASDVVEACKKLGVLAEKIQGDFSTDGSVEIFLERYLARFPRTKGIVNNVGNYLIAPFSQTQGEDWHSLFQTNFFTPIRLIYALLPQLKMEKGAIVNIGTSGLSTIKALLNAPAYAATKSALWFTTRTLAKEVAADQITVNMVSPGFLETSIDLDRAPDFPMGRPASLKEAASVVAFFFEPENCYITGQNIEVAGGIGL
ncbi:MAG: SDR family oxidoreductase [Chlamydiales bacterium]|nr:SDR family oxidoreductase [Chlamydiales bacterium]